MFTNRNGFSCLQKPVPKMKLRTVERDMHKLLACIHAIENKCKNQNMLGLIKIRKPQTWSGFIKLQMRPRSGSDLIKVRMPRPWSGLIKV